MTFRKYWNGLESKGEEKLDWAQEEIIGFQNQSPLERVFLIHQVYDWWLLILLMLFVCPFLKTFKATKKSRPNLVGSLDTKALKVCSLSML